MSLLFSLITFGEMKHEHGVGDLSMALSDENFSALFSIPAESIIGFEYEPKTSNDQKSKKEKIDQFEASFLEIIKIDSKFACKKTSALSEMKQEGNHGEYKLTFSAKCKTKISQTTIKINFKDKYPKIKKLNINFLSEKSTQSLGLLKGYGEIIVP
jgi:hypothetical protein